MIFLDLFFTFFKIGAFTFGGGYAMLPLIQEEVLRKNWSTEGELIDFIAVSESTPGPFAVNISTFIGSQMGGLAGAVCATLGVVLPSFIIILIVAQVFEKFKTNKIVAGCMTGLKPAVIGLIGSALVTIGKTVFFPAGFAMDIFSGYEFYMSLVLFFAMTYLALKKVNPIVIICISALVGIVAGFIFN